MCHKPSTLTMNGSATKRAGTSVTSAAKITGLVAPGAAASCKGDSPAYMAIDQVHGRLASLERCPTALGSMISMGNNFINHPGVRSLIAWILPAQALRYFLMAV